MSSNQWNELSWVASLNSSTNVPYSPSGSSLSNSSQGLETGGEEFTLTDSKSRRKSARQPQLLKSPLASASAGREVNTPHLFEKHKFGRNDICGFCFKQLSYNTFVSSSEYRCRVCKYPVHSKCKDFALAKHNCDGIAKKADIWRTDIQKLRKGDSEQAARAVDSFPPLRQVSLSDLPPLPVPVITNVPPPNERGGNPTAYISAKLANSSTTTPSSGAAGFLYAIQAEKTANSTSSSSSPTVSSLYAPAPPSTGANNAASNTATSTSSSASPALSAQDGARRDALRVVEIVRITMENIPPYAAAACQGNKSLPLKPTTTGSELKSVLIDKYVAGAHPDSREQLRKDLDNYRLFEPSGRRILADEKPYGRVKELLFKPAPDAKETTPATTTSSNPGSAPLARGATVVFSLPSSNLSASNAAPSPPQAGPLASSRPTDAPSEGSFLSPPSRPLRAKSVPPPLFAQLSPPAASPPSPRDLATDPPPASPSLPDAPATPRRPLLPDVPASPCHPLVAEAPSSPARGAAPSSNARLPISRSPSPRHDAASSDARSLSSASACGECRVLAERVAQMEDRLQKCEDLIARLQDLIGTQGSLVAKPTDALRSSTADKCWAQLISLCPDVHPSADCPLGLRALTLGRGASNLYVIADPGVSSEHCIVSLEKQEGGGDKAFLTDLSTNGTFLNGKLVGKGSKKALRSNDTITLCFPNLDHPELRCAFTFKLLAQSAQGGSGPTVEYEDLGDRILMENVQFSRKGLPEFSVPPKDQPFDRSYNGNHAVWLAYISSLTYGDPVAIRKIGLEFWSLKSVQFFEDEETNTRALGLVSERFAVIAFRGTESEENWKTNLNISMVPISEAAGAFSPEVDLTVLRKIKVHRGFHQALLSVWDGISRFAQDLVAEDPDLPIYLTGHSLGGALASLAWLYMTVLNPPISVRGIYTFGQPRPGNKHLADFLASAGGCVLQRICNRGDIVPSVPPSRPYGFRHLGTRIQIKQSGELMFEGSLNESEGFTRIAGSLSSSGLADHRQHNYILALQQHLDRNMAGQSSRSVYRGKGFKLNLTVVRAIDQRSKGDFTVVVRSSLGDFSTVTHAEKGPDPVWNEILEVPEIYYGDEFLVEVTSGDGRCNGCVLLQFYEFNSLELVEYPLQSRPGKRDKPVGSLVLSTSFSPLEQRAADDSATRTGPRLFGVPLAQLMEEQINAGGADHCPLFLARAAEVILETCLAVPGGFQPESEVDPLLYQMAKHAVNTTDQQLRTKDNPMVVMRLFYEWLSSLRVPLFSYEAYADVLNANQYRSADQIATIRLAISGLLPWQRYALALLCCLAEQLARNSHFTRRNYDQLAQQLGRCILFTQNPSTKEPLHIVEHQPLIQATIAFCIQNWRSIFAETVDRIPAGYQFDSFGIDKVSAEFRFKLAMNPPGEASPIRFMNKVSIDNKPYVISGTASGRIFLWHSQEGISFARAIELPEQGVVADEITKSTISTQLGANDDLSFKISRPLNARPKSVCTGIWDVGRTEMSKNKGFSSTWILGFEQAAALVLLPSEKAVLMTPASSNQVSFTCSCESSSTLYLGSSNGSVSLFMITDASNHWKVCLPPQAGRAITAIIYIPLTRVIWAGDSNGEIHVLSSATNKVVSRFRLYFDAHTLEDPIQAMIVLGEHVWISTAVGSLYAIHVASQKVTHRMERGVAITSFCPIDAAWVALGAADGQAEIWKIETFERCGQFSAHTASIKSILLTRSGSMGMKSILWIASEDGSISIWEISKPMEQMATPQFERPILRSTTFNKPPVSRWDSSLIRRPSVANLEEGGILAFDT